MQKSIAVIIVTYNGEEWVDRQVNALNQCYYNLEIYLLDNCSQDNTVNKWRSSNLKWPLHLIPNATNLGFGQGNNRGMEIAYRDGHSFFVLLNQDAWPKAGTIETLVDQLCEDDSIAINSCLHYNGQGTATTAYPCYLPVLGDSAGAGRTRLRIQL